jgi:hypothetical protein
MHYSEFREHVQSFSQFLDQSSQQVYVHFQLLKEFLVLHVIDPFTFEEFSFDIVEVFAETMRAHFIDQPVVLLLVNIVNKHGDMLNPREFLRIDAVRYFPARTPRK